MAAKMKIPFLDLVTPHLELEAELTNAFRNSLREAGFVGGPVVERFEQEFAHFCNVEHCVGVASGTDAVRFALIAGGVRYGEAVVTVPNTFIATTEAISQTGAIPEFVDIDERTYNIDVQKLREYLELQCDPDRRTGRPVSRKSGRVVSAVVPVHLYGQPADMDGILELAAVHNLLVVEDACQAHGAEHCSKADQTWKKAGVMGHAAAFSFYPGKNLGACGEAGAVTTNHRELAHMIRMLRDHGQSEKYYHEMEGYNGRLDAIQAGLLAAKLPHLSTWNNARRQRAELYQELLQGATGVILPYEPPWAKSVYHLFVIRVREREQLIAHLREKGIGTGIHYPIPLHLQKAYQSLGYRRGDFPISEQAAIEVISLPMFPHITLEELNRVAEEIWNFTCHVRENPEVNKEVTCKTV